MDIMGMNVPEQTTIILEQGFDLLRDFGLPVLIGVCVTLIAGAIALGIRRFLRNKKQRSK